MATIATLSVKLTANTTAFGAGMSSAAGQLTGLRGAYDRLTNSARAYESMQQSVGGLKLAGAETLGALQTTFAVARSELRKFGRNRDVQVAIEIGREYVDEAWIKARATLQRLANATRLNVAAQIVSDRANSAVDWIAAQRRQLGKQLSVRLNLAREPFDNAMSAVQGRLESLKRFRAVRIVLAAVNATKMPVAAAMQMLGPLRKLAATGVGVALSATHFGVAAGVQKAKALLGGLVTYGRSAVASLGGALVSVGTSVVGVGAMIGGAAVAGVGGLATYAIKLAADAEQARVSFTTMLGSADKARTLIGQINQFAAATPFQTPELINASKKLLAFGVDAQQIIPTMRSLGDVSAGLNIPIGELAEIYGKARVQGRLFAEDVNQLTGRGIPVIQEFAKQFGVSEGEVRKLVEAGKIGFPQLQQAMVSLTTGGGKFAGMMQAQSLTVAGLFSTLQDTITMNLTRVGEVITEKLDLRGVLAGVTNAISAMATTAMPIIEAFIGGLAQGGNVGQRAGELVLSGSEMIATGLAYVIDYSKLLVVGFRLMQSGAALAIGGLLKAVDYLGAGLVKLLNYLPGVKLEWTDTIVAMADGVLDEAQRLGQEAGKAYDGFANNDSAKSVAQFFNQVRANARQTAEATTQVGDAAAQTAMKVEQSTVAQNAAVVSSLKQMQEQVQQIGLSDGQKKIADLSGQGATADQIAQAQKLLDVQDQLSKLSAIDTGDPMGDFAAKMERLQKLYAQGAVTAQQFAALRDTAKQSMGEKLADEAKKVIESVMTPLEAYTEEMNKLQALLDQGLISRDVFDRATAKAKQGLSGMDGADVQPAAPEAIASGSAAAQKLVYDISHGQEKLTKDDMPKKQYAEAQQQTRLLEQVVKNGREATGGVELTVVEI